MVDNSDTFISRTPHSVVQFPAASGDSEIFFQSIHVSCPGLSTQIHNFLSFWFFLQSTPVLRTLTIGLLWALWTWIYMLSFSWTLDIALSLNPYPSLSVNVLTVPIPCQLVILIQSLFFKLSTFDL